MTLDMEYVQIYILLRMEKMVPRKGGDQNDRGIAIFHRAQDGHGDEWLQG